MKIDDDSNSRSLALSSSPMISWSSNQKDRLPVEVVGRIHKVVERMIGHHKCLVLDQGLDIEVLSPAAIGQIPPALPDEALIGKSDSELRQLLSEGKISPNQIRRMQMPGAARPQ